MSAIVIGLGSTGLHIVEYVQRFHYQFKEKNKSDKVEYLFLETNLSAKPLGTPAGNEIISVPISLKEMAAQIPALKQQKITNEWIPSVNTALSTGEGAGGQSAYGRLALWMNWSNVYQAVNHAWTRVRGDNQTNIYIVGSLTGGTCTGTFIDVAYMVRQITRSNNVYGLFLIPGNSHVGISGGDNVLENYLIALSSLKSLTRVCADGEYVYDCTWVGGKHVQQSASPFSQTYLLSTDYANHRANITKLDDLCRVAGLNICARLLDIADENGNMLQNFQTEYSAGIMNGAKQDLNNHGGYTFSTFGTTLMHYPKSQLVEWFGLTLSKQILQRWTDPENYVGKNGEQQSVVGQRNRINNEFFRDFESVLADALKAIDGLQTAVAADTEKEIAVEVNRLKTDKTFTIYGAFNSNKSDNHYGFVSNNVNIIKDKLIDGIYGLFEKYMKEYKNLNVLRNFYDGGAGNKQSTLQKHIEKILAYWKKQYRVDGEPSSFNKNLQWHIDKLNKEMTLPKCLAQKDKFLKEQFWNLYTITKLQFVVPVLKQVMETIEARQDQELSMRGEKYALPTKRKIEDMIAYVQNVVKLPKGVIGHDIDTRLQELDAEMTSSTHFKALFISSKDADKKKIEGDYNNLPPAKKMTGEYLVGDKIFSYLFDDRNNSEQIYEECSSRGTRYVHDNKLIDSIGINGLLEMLDKRNPIDRQYSEIQYFFRGAEPEIRANVPGIIGLKDSSQFQDHRNIKLMYVTSNIMGLRNAIKSKPDTCYLNMLSASTQNCVDVAAFSNALMVYQEYGYMVDNNTFNPITDIAINMPIKRIVLDIPEEKRVSRCPYVSWEQMEAQIQNIGE